MNLDSQQGQHTRRLARKLCAQMSVVRVLVPKVYIKLSLMHKSHAWERRMALYKQIQECDVNRCIQVSTKRVLARRCYHSRQANLSLVQSEGA